MLTLLLSSLHGLHMIILEEIAAVAHNLDPGIRVVSVDPEQELVVGKKLCSIIAADCDPLRSPALAFQVSQCTFTGSVDTRALHLPP